jgi:glycerophosphoryl diester phosphodiesterase
MQDFFDLWRGVNRRLRVAWLHFLRIHLAYTAFGLAILVPLTGLTVRTLLALGGKTAVADQDIAWFLLSPLGVASVVLVAGMLVAIAAAEQVAMLVAAAQVAAGCPLRSMAALKFSLSRTARVLSFAVVLVARILVIVLPFVATAAVAAWLLMTDYDINFYLSQRPPEFLVAAVIIGLLALAMLATLLARLAGWSLALPLLLGGTGTRASFSESERLTRGHRSWILRVLLAWAAMALALAAIMAMSIDLLGSWLVPVAFGSLRWLVASLGLLIVIGALGSLLVSALVGGAFSLVTVELHARLVDGRKAAEAFGVIGGAEPVPTVRNQWRVVALLAGVAVASVGAGAWALAGAQAPDVALIIAHRGAAGRAPENTLAAVRAAIDDGADWVEIDVQETADGQVVVVHDSDFMKLAGARLKVWQGSLEEIRELDVGSWFAPEFAHERVPTLEAVLDELKTSDARLVIELKYYGHDQDLERRVVELVERTGMVDRVAIMSLKFPGIQKVRALRPDWNIGLLAATAVGDLARLDADFLAVNAGLAVPQFIRQAHAAGKKVLVWTINDPVSMSRMFSLGVDGIITDEPAMARQVLRERAELSSAERLLVHAAGIFGTPSPPRVYRDESP